MTTRLSDIDYSKNERTPGSSFSGSMLVGREEYDDRRFSGNFGGQPEEKEESPEYETEEQDEGLNLKKLLKMDVSTF